MTKAGDDRPIMDHEYDGIQEYDNPMPRWWILLFIVTIIAAPVYYLAPGDIGAGAKKTEVYDKEMAAFAAERDAFTRSTIIWAAAQRGQPGIEDLARHQRRVRETCLLCGQLLARDP